MEISLPKNLITEFEEISNYYKTNTTELIINALQNYLQEQKTKLLYKKFDKSAKELNNKKNLQTLDEFLDEL